MFRDFTAMLLKNYGLCFIKQVHGIHFSVLTLILTFLIVNPGFKLLELKQQLEMQSISAMTLSTIYTLLLRE